jgi:hypothetical protein
MEGYEGVIYGVFGGFAAELLKSSNSVMKMSFQIGYDLPFIG